MEGTGTNCGTHQQCTLIVVGLVVSAVAEDAWLTYYNSRFRGSGQPSTAESKSSTGSRCTAYVQD